MMDVLTIGVLKQKMRPKKEFENGCPEDGF